VKRFLLAQAIESYARLLAVEPDPRLRDLLHEQMAAARRERASLVAATTGLGRGADQSSRAGGRRRQLEREFRKRLEGSQQALLLIEPGPGLHIVEINDACSAATLADRGAVAGQKLFDAFPDNPSNRTADGVANLFDIMRAATEAGRPRELISQPYDVRDDAGRFVRKVWRSRTTPIFDEQGRLTYLFNDVEDVTGRARRSRTGRGGPASEAGSHPNAEAGRPARVWTSRSVWSQASRRFWSQFSRKGGTSGELVTKSLRFAGIGVSDNK
jgi:PAS domain-containing protein